MDTRRSMLPKGVATFLPEGAARRRAIESALLTLFRSWGYQEVITPIFEYLDVLSSGIGEEQLDRAFKFVDRSSGRIMVLRPDVTPQIARMAAMLLSQSALPLRLCYSANVFRHEDEHAGRDREIHQMGVECIGLPGIDGDAEMVMIAVEALRHLGLKDFKIAIGHMGVVGSLLEGLGDDPGLKREILHAVARKDSAQLERLIPKGVLSTKDFRALVSLPDQFGGEEVLAEAEKLCQRTGSRIALSEIQKLFRVLRGAGYGAPLVFDLGEVRRFDYYTGIVFEVFVEGVGYELGGGGRYDRLLERFGHSVASTGFALHIERLQAVLDKINGAGAYFSADLLLLYAKGGRESALKFAENFRKKGLRVICQPGISGLKSQVDEARRLRARNLAICEEKADGRDVLWVEMEKKVKKRINAEKLGEVLVRECATANPVQKGNFGGIV